jgi:hypothetical protein
VHVYFSFSRHVGLFSHLITDMESLIWLHRYRVSLQAKFSFEVCEAMGEELVRDHGSNRGGEK